MTHDWQELTRLTKGEEIILEQVRMKKQGIVLKGQFDLPPLARLTMEDQIFMIAFIRCHGSIKDMEELFDISYPTVKNRLNRIAQLLEFVEINPPANNLDILNRLERGEINVQEAEKTMRRKND